MGALSTVYTDEMTSNWLVHVHENIMDFPKIKERIPNDKQYIMTIKI